MRTLLLLVAVVSLVAAGCGDDEVDVAGGGDNPGVVLDGRTFLSTGVTENGAPRDLVPDTRIALSFADGNIGATAGCNSLGGSYELDGDVLVVDEMSQTEMGCDAPRHAQDEFVASVLADRPVVTLAGDALTLTTDTITIQFVDREVADPDRPLIGPTWVVTGFIDGEIASSFAVDGDPGRIRFPDESSFEWFDGCNGGNGDAEVSDGSTGGPVAESGEIRWGGIVGTTRACPETQAYQDAYDEMFAAGGVTYEIEARDLTILNRDGAGVTFRAETE